MNRYAMELLGTFVLVFTIVLTTINPGANAAAPFAIGLALAIMIYAGGQISGAHYNPAVTIAVTLRGACKLRDSFPYIAAQVAGGLLGAFAALALKTSPQITPLLVDTGPAVFAELAFTTMLAFVVLRTATVPAVDGNSYYGLSIGGTVTTGAIAVGGISGGVFNPAVGIALFAIGVVPSGQLLPYVAAQAVAGIIAAALFRLTSPQEDVNFEDESPAIPEQPISKVVGL